MSMHDPEFLQTKISIRDAIHGATAIDLLILQQEKLVTPEDRAVALQRYFFCRFGTFGERDESELRSDYEIAQRLGDAVRAKRAAEGDSYWPASPRV